MSFRKLCYLIYSDMYRYFGHQPFIRNLYTLVWTFGATHSFWFRIGQYLRSKSILVKPLYYVARYIQRIYMVRFGFEVSPETIVGSGLYIGHIGGITISRFAVIGRNCNISQGVTIGATQRGEKAGAPIIGDNVYIGPGARVIGKITIGNNVAIGANAVVSKDLPDYAIAVGIPARSIGSEGSTGYIVFTDYDKHLGAWAREFAAPEPVCEEKVDDTSDKVL